MRNKIGFTLIELMSTMAIGLIIMGIGMPAMVNIVQDSELTAEVNAFVGAINLARSTAITEQKNVFICVSSDSETCTGTGWDEGWITYLNEADSSVRLLSVRDANEQGIIVILNEFDESTALEFSNVGAIAGTNKTGTIVFCDDRGSEYAKAVMINPVGRPIVANDTNGDKIVEDNGGNNVSCS